MSIIVQLHNFNVHNCTVSFSVSYISRGSTSDLNSETVKEGTLAFFVVVVILHKGSWISFPAGLIQVLSA